jgi:hypothetical protein
LEGAALSAPNIWDTAERVPPFKNIRFIRVIRGFFRERKMPDVDVKSNPAFSSRCAAKTELCVTVFSLWALVSFDSKVLTAYPMDDQLIHPRELAVDLFNRASK